MPILQVRKWGLSEVKAKAKAKANRLVNGGIKIITQVCL